MTSIAEKRVPPRGGKAAHLPGFARISGGLPAFAPRWMPKAKCAS